jgi:hypothetical protein
MLLAISVQSEFELKGPQGMQQERELKDIWDDAAGRNVQMVRTTEDESDLDAPF